MRCVNYCKEKKRAVVCARTGNDSGYLGKAMKNGLLKSVMAIALVALTATASALAWSYWIIKDSNGNVIAIVRCDDYGCYRM